MTRSIFSGTYCPYFLVSCLVRPLLNQNFCFLIVKSSLYILDYSPFLNVSFAKILARSMVCLILFTVSFAEQNIVKILMKQLINFGAFGVVSKISLPRTQSSMNRFSPLLSSRSLWFCTLHLCL